MDGEGPEIRAKQRVIRVSFKQGVIRNETRFGQRWTSARCDLERQNCDNRHLQRTQ